MQIFPPGVKLPPNNWHVEPIDVTLFEVQIFVQKGGGANAPFRQPSPSYYYHYYYDDYDYYYLLLYKASGATTATIQ